MGSDYALGLASLVAGVEGPYKGADVRQLAETLNPQVDAYVDVKRRSGSRPPVLADLLQAAQTYKATVETTALHHERRTARHTWSETGNVSVPRGQGRS